MANIELFDKYINGELSDSERNEFKGRLESDKEFATDFNIYMVSVIGICKEAEQDKLYAHLSIDTYWRDKDTLYLIVDNRGPSDAYNVSIKDLDKDSFLFRDLTSSLPIETIDSGDSAQLELLVYTEMPEKALIQVTWEDDSNEKHTDKVIIHIHG